MRGLETMLVIARGDLEVASWPLACSGAPHMGTVDDLAFLRLAAGRAGYSVRVRNPSRELRELLDLSGLGGLLVEECGLRQTGRETEDLEQAGVEKVVVPDDPVA